MNRALILFVVLLALLGVVVAQAGDEQAPDERPKALVDTEPPLLLRLIVGGETHAIRLDEPLELPTPAAKTTVLLRAEPHRLFPYGGVRFRYPRHFAFTADRENPAVRQWTLDGSDCVIMLFRFPGDNDATKSLRDSVDAARAQWGERARTSDTALDLNGVKLEGTMFDIMLAGQRLKQSYFGLRVGEDSMVIILQDSLQENGQASADYSRTLKMLEESFEVE